MKKSMLKILELWLLLSFTATMLGLGNMGVVFGQADTDEAIVLSDLEAIVMENLLTVPLANGIYLIDPLALDENLVGNEGSEITWSSTNVDVISDRGMVYRGYSDETVTITATAKYGAATGTKDFEFIVPGIDTDVNGMPGNIYPVYYDSFSSANIKSRIKEENFESGDALKVENGKLVFSRDRWSSKESGVSFYNDALETAVTGEFVYQFTISKTREILRVRLFNHNWNPLVQIYWQGSDFNIYYREEENSNSQIIKTLNIPGSQSTKVTIHTVLDSGNPKINMWVNNELVLDSVYAPSQMSPASFKWAQFYSMNYGSYGGNGDFMIDNIGLYRVRKEMSDLERVEKDAAALNAAGLLTDVSPVEGAIYSNLELPAYGENGSRIVWSSSDEEHISSDGIVSRPVAENKRVSMTARVVSGLEEITRVFEFTVLGEQIVLDDMPTVYEPIAEFNFENGADGSYMDETKLVKNETGGTVEVCDGALRINKPGSDTSQVGVSVYNNTDEGGVSGVIGLEFDVSREQANTIQIRSMDPNGNLYYSMAWGASAISAYYSNSPEVAASSSNVWVSDEIKNKIHFNLMFDTAESTYWLWVDGKLAVSRKYSRSAGTSSIGYTMFYLERANRVEIDNYKVYHAMPPQALRLDFDLQNFSEESIHITEPPGKGIVSDNLNLVKSLKYGTEVLWSSSREDLINPDTGVVSCPVDSDSNPEVTLTANFSNCGMESSRTYFYTVLRKYTDESDYQKNEVNDIQIRHLTEEKPSEIRKSLDLVEKGFYGSPVSWSSSDTRYITSSGRVIRPRFDEPNANVTMTATIGRYAKTFEFVVLADEAPTDPMHTSDEKFFGVWTGNGYVEKPQLDYSLKGMEAVETCVRSGDYSAAKDALLEYFKSRDIESPLNVGTRYPGWVNARIAGVYELAEAAAYYRGTASVTSDAYEAINIDIYNAGGLSKTQNQGLQIMALYNENTSAYVLGTDVEDKRMAPKLTLTVDGSARTFYANNAATIRAGKYSTEHCGDNKTLQAKMFGDFLGDETYRILLNFDLSGIGEGVITDGKLTVYAKKSVPYAKEKTIVVMEHKQSSWNEKTVCWNNMDFKVHNYNGLIGGVEWGPAKNSNVEFAYQKPRMMHLRSTLAEYEFTKDEKYAYSILTDVMDLICDVGDKTPYPRSLDAAGRMQEMVPLINSLVSSKYMTAEFCTAFLKYMYDQFSYFPTRVNATGNWREYEQLAVVYATSAYPELSNAKTTLAASIESWNNAFSKSFLPDGTYQEATGGYHASSFNMYMDFKKACRASGVELSNEFDEALQKALKYILLTRGPTGLTVMYGDEGGSQVSANRYDEIIDLFGDRELQFIDSRGAKGVKPEWTSYQFEDGRYTMMRSSWETNAIYLFTEVYGGGTAGGHGDADDNGIILMGNGKRLLVDSGKFTYNSYDPGAMYGASTEGHNTVVINDASQRKGWLNDYLDQRGTIHKWQTNRKFDFLSQSTISYPEHDHMRNILFVKSGFLIVTDYITPRDMTKINNYKQFWHMSHDAGIESDDQADIIRSRFSDGKDILVLSADKDKVACGLKDGHYDPDGASDIPIKVGYFEQNCAGTATFDTVLYPTNKYGEDASVERIPVLDSNGMAMANSDATAMKITINKSTGTCEYYYMYNHRHKTDDITVYGDFTSDARIALVGFDKEGNVIETVMSDGSYITLNGKEIVGTPAVVSDIASTITGSTLDILSGASALSPSDISLSVPASVKTVLFNGDSKAYSISEGEISISTESAPVKDELDDNRQHGIISGGESGGENGGGNGGESVGGNGGESVGGSVGGNVGESVGGNVGGNGGGSGGAPDVPDIPDNTIFEDIKGHWAESNIAELYKKGLVNGYENGMFYPENTVARSELIAMVMRLIGDKASSEMVTHCFEDVTNQWFAEDIYKALQLGIIAEDTQFRPNDSITREETCKVISNALKLIGVEKADTKDMPYFTDSDKISPWAEEYIVFAVSIGLMEGKNDNIFDPQGISTRAEAATVILRAMRVLERSGGLV